MEDTGSTVRVSNVSLNEFLDKEFKFCFVCGSTVYEEFYKNGHVYRICSKCLDTEIVVKFIKGLP